MIPTLKLGRTLGFCVALSSVTPLAATWANDGAGNQQNSGSNNPGTYQPPKLNVPAVPATDAGDTPRVYRTKPVTIATVSEADYPDEYFGSEEGSLENSSPVQTVAYQEAASAPQAAETTTPSAPQPTPIPESIAAPQPIPMMGPPPGEIIYESMPSHRQSRRFGSGGFAIDSEFVPSSSCGCDGTSTCDGCASSCDTIGGCDSIGWGGGCDGCGGCWDCRVGCLALPRLFNDCWFGSAEYILWTRRGQQFPVLAAQLNAAGNAVVAPLFGGNGRVGEDSESGGRFTIGRWLDSRRNQSIVGRFWALAEEDFGFSANQTSAVNIGIPFTQAPATPNVYSIITANQNAGEFLNINYQSEVLGADVSLRQAWVKGLGGRIDFLYGYQFFRLNESLTIDGRSDELVGIRNAADFFDVENEFHGGQLGIAMNYRENRWTFDGLFKVALGSLNRRVALDSTTDVLAPPAGGYFIYPTNEGASSDSTFAVMPEINLQLGYAYSRNVNFTVGYSYLMVSDVIQVAGTIDTTVDTAIGQPTGRPTRNFRANDYWMHGVNFGLTFNY